MWGRDLLLAYAASGALRLSFYVFIPTLPLYVVARGGSAADVGLVAGIYSLVAVPFHVLAGRAADRFTARRTFLAGAALFTVCAALYPLPETIGSLLVLRVFHGAAWATGMTAVIVLVADAAPPTRRGEAMGYFGTVANVAMALAPALGVVLVEAAGFGLLATGAALLSLVAGATVLPVAATPSSSPGLSPSSYARFRPAVFPVTLTLLTTLPYGVVLAFGAVHGVHVGAANPGLFFTVYALVIMGMRPLMGRVADRWGRSVALLPGWATMAAAFVLLGLVPTPTGFLASAVVYALGFGAVYPALAAWTIDRLPVERRALGLGVYTAAFEGGLALGAMALGFVAERWGSTVLFLTTAGVCASAFMAYGVGLVRGDAGARAPLHGG